MYERFFGLGDAPFRLTPDPRYLFLSRKHADALAHLRLGLSESSGFVCITGDVGTGKTTVLRHFLGELAPEVERRLRRQPDAVAARAAADDQPRVRPSRRRLEEAAHRPLEPPPARAASREPVLGGGGGRGAGALDGGAGAPPTAVEPRDDHREAAAHRPGRAAAAARDAVPSRARPAEPADHATLAHRAARPRGDDRLRAPPPAGGERRAGARRLLDAGAARRPPAVARRAAPDQHALPPRHAGRVRGRAPHGGTRVDAQGLSRGGDAAAPGSRTLEAARRLGGGGRCRRCGHGRAPRRRIRRPAAAAHHDAGKCASGLRGRGQRRAGTLHPRSPLRRLHRIRCRPSWT